MAGSPTTELYINITPVTAVFSASYLDDQYSFNNISFTITQNNCVIDNNVLKYNNEQTSLYGTLTVTAYNHTYTYTLTGSDTINVVLPTQTLYAWDGYDLKGDPTNDVYYTLTETITSQEPCYDEHGQLITNRWINSSGELVGA